VSTSGGARAEEQARRRVAALGFGLLAAAVLFSLSIIMLVPPVVEGRLALQAVISVPLLAGLYVVSRNVLLLVIGVAFGAVSTAFGVASIAWQDDWLLVVDLALRAGFLALTAAWIAREVLRQTHISTDTILGGICVYLLLGMLYALLDVMIAISVTGSFQMNGAPLLVSPAGHHRLESMPAMLYFSFSTLTTAAFGDILPMSPLARLLAISEAMIGQLYPTIFIARLVGLYVAQRQSRRDG
jgi:hypothetical protein